MIVRYLRRVFVVPTTSRSQIYFWFTLSLTFSVIYSLIALAKGFSSNYVVQDDARQHVFWMQRFMDPQLFPQDLIADYFQSVAPAGYTNFYRLAAIIGINPLIFNKLLPPFLGLITTAYCFRLSWQIFPVPLGAFISTLLLNQNIWMKDDLISATPRAFIYPLFLAFLYYLTRRCLFPSLGAIALLGLFYPQGVFLCSGMLILQLLQWQKGRFKLTSNPQDYRFCFFGLGVAFLIMLPYALTTSEFAPVITVDQAKQLPEFLPGGRTPFFVEKLDDFFLYGGRSGMFPRSLFTPATLAFGLLLPILALFTEQFPQVKQIKSKILLLPQLLLVSLGMFFAAHVFLFKLHLPSRYTQHSFRIIIALATGIALTLILDAIVKWTLSKAIWQKLISLLSVALIATSLILYPSFVAKFTQTQYKIGSASSLYEYFLEQPSNITIASLAEEANNLPTFSGRSILVGREYGIPYHWGYYKEFRQRAMDLIQAQYSSNISELINFIRQYNVDFWLLEPSAFQPEYVANNKWLQQYQPAANLAVTSLQEGNIPALVDLKNECSTFKSDRFDVLAADCIMSTLANNSIGGN